MKLNKTDYVLERASDGGYYAWLTVNMQCNAYGESPEEAVPVSYTHLRAHET